MPAANLSGSLSLAGLVLDVALSSPANGQALVYSSGSSKWSNQGVVNTFNTRSGAVALGSGDVTGALGYTPLAGNQAITLSGDASGSGATGIAVTLATVNSNVGSFTTANITVDAKGRITAASSGAGGPSAANPTASVGLSAVNGSRPRFMRSDAAPQLSQAIVPTWTGLHTFSLSPTSPFGTGGNCEAWGSGAGNRSATGAFNTFVGNNSGSYITSGTTNTGVGWNALNLVLSGSSNTAIGTSALQVLTTGVGNLGIGQNAMGALTSGSNNVAFGVFSGSSLTVGSDNTLLGYATDASSNSTVLGIALGFAAVCGSNEFAISSYINTQRYLGTGINLIPAAARTSGSASYFTLTSPADTTLSSGECIGVNLNLSTTRQFSTGNFALQRKMVIQAPTYSAVAASTITTAATLAITGAPIAGTNVTITNPYALMVQTGQSYFGGPISFSFGGDTVAFGPTGSGYCEFNSNNIIYMIAASDIIFNAPTLSFSTTSMTFPSSGGRLGFYSTPAVLQPAAITAPTGGSTIDTQARTAINAILAAIGASAGGIGITA